MSTPTTMKVVRVRGGFDSSEWATICWHGWQTTGVDKRPRECGEILIHSSFGSWANGWGHCGEPFDKFLMDVECDYCAEKFMGSKAYVFDGEKSVRHLRCSLIEHRRKGDITKNDARSIWDWIDENEFDLVESSDGRFVSRLSNCADEADWKDRVTERPDWDTGPGRGARQFLEEPWERLSTSLDGQFAAFWEQLWPAFVEQLKKGGAQ